MNEAGSEDRLIADLRTALEGASRTKVEVNSLRSFGDGHSGHTYSAVFESGGYARRCVVRLSPPGVRIAGPADIGRQGRIMASLWKAGLPVPEVIATDSEPVVDGRSYAILELVDGCGWEDAVRSTSARAVAEAAADFLRRVHALSPEATGIGDEAPISPAEEVARWSRLFDRGAEAAREPGLRLAKALAASAPQLGRPTLVHGDFHYANLIFGSGAEIVAVVDWEIAHLGYRLLDFGCLAVATMRRRYLPEPNPTGSLEISLPELAEIHGVDPTEGAWATAASCLKYGAILAYNLELHRQGKKLDPVYEELQGTMVGLLEDGEQMVRQSKLDVFTAMA